jgi:hypothetical protein
MGISAIRLVKILTSTAFYLCLRAVMACARLFQLRRILKPAFPPTFQAYDPANGIKLAYMVQGPGKENVKEMTLNKKMLIRF